jgi:hypothetical protein
MTVNTLVVERLLETYWQRIARYENQYNHRAAAFWRGKYEVLDFLLWEVRPNGKRCNPRIEKGDEI